MIENGEKLYKMFINGSRFFKIWQINFKLDVIPQTVINFTQGLATWRVLKYPICYYLYGNWENQKIKKGTQLLEEDPDLDQFCRKLNTPTHHGLVTSLTGMMRA